MVFLNKIVDFFDKSVYGFFKQNIGLFGKIVDLFGKIVDLLFERGVLPYLENPLGYGPAWKQLKISFSIVI